MRLLIDAQLPARLALLLTELGHDVVHTSQLPLGNRTPAEEIVRTADAEDRVVVTKDREFVDSHVLSGRPRLLLLIATGNIRNAELLPLVVANIAAIDAAFESSDMVELSRYTLVVH